jgi:hypothetical protein
MNLRFHNAVDIPAGKIMLRGELVIPLKAEAIIIFSHGSGSSWYSPHNQMVAKYLIRKTLELYYLIYLLKKKTNIITTGLILNYSPED